MVRFIVEVGKIEKFKEFLIDGENIESFHQIENYFLISMICHSREEYIRFLERVDFRFGLVSSKVFCKGKCRDGTDCLNTAKDGDYYRKH